MRIVFALAAAAVCMNGVAAEYFVATNGCDGADGSAARPWRTIQRAADVAKAGDIVTIRGGVYREWVKPANAGRADAPITYRAAKGEKVVVTGADPARGWAGIWLDWMAQGARVSCNTLWCNPRDLFLEVNHGPILVEGNDCLSSVAVLANSQGIAFVGNRMLGRHAMNNEQRCTPVFKPHTVTLESIDSVPCGSGGHVYVNNILAQDPRFAKEAFPSRFEDNWFIPANCWKGDPATGKFTITPPPDSKKPDFKPVDAKRLGKPVFVNQEFPAPTLGVKWPLQ